MGDLINKIYPGKTLLFGEYTVIHGGDSLAMPLYKKTANWDFDELEFESRESLDKFIDYLVVKGIGSVKLEKFSSLWQGGLFLESNIPAGYGAGSSGAVVAAVYDSFLEHTTEEPEEIRKIFKLMENHFHGSSSGLDPLVSYYGKGVHISNSCLKLVDIDGPLLSNLYLWDSGESRSTAPLVEWYKKKLERGFRAIIEERLIPMNNELITSFLEDKKDTFSYVFEKVEKFQLKYFTPMFPSHIREVLLGLKEEFNCNFKLCGAGGGGYYLIYCKNQDIKHKASIIPLA